MLYFREKELEKIESFCTNPSERAMAIYGRRRTGKTQLITTYAQSCRKKIIYFQCPGYDYKVCLADFVRCVIPFFPEDTVISGITSFKDLLSYISGRYDPDLIVVIDEFPFLAKKNENVPAEFQWIIDHGLGRMKLILLGSNLSFMKEQINSSEAPLNGCFDEILRILPFSFNEVHSLFPNFEDAVNVYSQTGGIAQYVMFFKSFPDVEAASDSLFFDRNGRLFREANNMLLQELRDVTSYTSILRAIAGGTKNSGQIAAACSIDQRGVYTYLQKLEELEIVSTVDNPLSANRRDKRYRISDMLFRFNYTFIEPNISMITSIGSASRRYILDDRYKEYLGFVYEDIIREKCYEYALSGILPFMPETVGKWWGSVQFDGQWHESEVDIVAYDRNNLVVCECKYKNKAVGIKELDVLKHKSEFIPSKGRGTILMLASRSGFTSELKDLADSENIILIDKA